MEPGSKKRLQGWTEVLSDAGCYVHAAESLVTGTVVRLRIEMNALTFDTWARVIRSVRDGMGLAFFDTPESQRAILKDWLEEVAHSREI